MTAVALILIGLAALVLGAELLVRAGTHVASLLGVPPILIGLTVVSVGTSFPELATGINAALAGSGSMAVGNIAGTNTFNLLFILGLSALLMPVQVDLRTLRLDVPVMIVAALALLAAAWNLVLTRIEGAIFVAAAIAYTLALVLSVRKEDEKASTEFDQAFAARDGRPRARQIAWNALLLAAGLVVIVIGSDWLVGGAMDLARRTGISEAFIGLTIVAIGTSSPELVTTIVSTIRGKRDIAIGNLLGSGVYNIFAILGITLLVPSGGVLITPEIVLIDIPVMLAATVACLPILLNRTMSRWEGGLFVAAYCVYLAYLIAART